MIRDLRDGDVAQEASCDLCIIGAGAAGLTLFSVLEERARARGESIIIIESGGFEPDPDTQFLYQGYIAGQALELAGTRLRCFGGSTQHWSGLTRPLMPIDMAKRPWVPHSGWPISHDEITLYYPRACEILGVGPFDYASATNPHPDAPALHHSSNASIDSCLYRVSAPVHLGDVMREQMRAATATTTILHANVTELVPTADATHMDRVEARTLEGKRLTIRAKRFVLAAGGIENPRLLLASRSVERHGVANANDVVGRYFLEHPHLDFGATLLGTDDPALGAWWRAYATRNFTGPVVTRHAFCVTPQGQEREGICGFVAVPRWLNVESPPEHGPVRIELLLMSEQQPNPDSRVMLAEDQPPDALGMPRTRLNWRVRESDLKTLTAGVRLIAEEIGSRGLGIVREGTQIQPERFPHYEDVYPGGHHMGTTRMSDDPNFGVVDRNCKVHGYDNFYIAGSSVYPTSGFCNPTLTIVALTLRLAEHLSAQPSSRG